MISLEANKIIRDGKEHEIEKFCVWFHIRGLGFCESIEELREVCGNAGMNMNQASPVSVAVAKDTHEVMGV